MYEKSCASSNHIKSWKDIDFGTAEYEVKKLQMRIAKAVKENRVGKIKSLQWTLTHSFYAKAIAVKRVTENKGSISAFNVFYDCHSYHLPVSVLLFSIGISP